MTDREPRRYSDPANHHSRSATNAAPKDTASPVYDGYAPYAYSTALEQNPASTSDALLIASDARIDNGDELRSALRLERAKSLDATDSLLILACYQRWGESFVERLIGDFAFVIVDRSRREVFAACDGMSMRTLYFAAQGSQLCFASDCGTLLRLPFVGSSLNSTAIALWVNGYPDPDLSMFKDIQRLRPGYCLRATNSGLSIRKFWDLDPDSSLRLATPADYADRLCSLLTQAVADRIPNGTDHVACQLSGGMDSPSIAASLCELGQDSGMPVHALSHQYPAASAQDETSDIDAIRSMLSLASHQYLRTEKYSSSSYADLYPSHGDSPGMVLSPRYSDDVVHAANQGARVLFTGSGGDEMCWGHSRSYEKRLASGDLKVMAEVATGCKEQSLPVAKTMMGLLFKPMLARMLRGAGGTQSTGTRLPEWQDPSCTAANEVQDYIRAHSLSESRRIDGVFAARYNALRWSSTYFSVRSHEYVARQHVVQMAHPFFDQRLAEFSFAIPDHLWNREGQPKWLLRKAMKGRLPDSHLAQRSKVTFESFFQQLLRINREEVRDSLSTDYLFDAGYADKGALLQVFDATMEGSRALDTRLLFLVQLQSWLETHAYGT